MAFYHIGYFPCGLVKDKDQFGNPFQRWDQETYFPTYGTDISSSYYSMVCSASESSLIAVYGDHTFYPIGLTLEEMMEFYWKWQNCTASLTLNKTMEIPAITGEYAYLPARSASINETIELTLPIGKTLFDDSLQKMCNRHMIFRDTQHTYRFSTGGEHDAASGNNLPTSNDGTFLESGGLIFFSMSVNRIYQFPGHENLPAVLYAEGLYWPLLLIDTEIYSNIECRHVRYANFITGDIIEYYDGYNATSVESIPKNGPGIFGLYILPFNLDPLSILTYALRDFPIELNIGSTTKNGFLFLLERRLTDTIASSNSGSNIFLGPDPEGLPNIGIAETGSLDTLRITCIDPVTF